MAKNPVAHKRQKVQRGQRGRALDLVGHIFERLTVVEKAGKTKYGAVKWRCQCLCGNETTVFASELRRGGSRSCGCLMKEVSSRVGKQNFTRHGMSREPVYSIWQAMIARCLNPEHPTYKDYGGRGITVCARWLSFQNFFADMGPRPSPKHSLDRYPDNDGNYKPANCRWATRRQQMNNTRSNRIVIFKGRSMTVTEASREAGLNPGTVRNRLWRGWSIKRALS